MPTGLTLNLIHNYAPLVWSSQGDFIVFKSYIGLKNQPYIDLTSPSAIEVPLLISKKTFTRDKSGDVRRILSFPEISHELASRLFLEGQFVATIEPAEFIRPFYDTFTAKRSNMSSAQPPKNSFWHYVGTCIPPYTFKGGSDLAVLKNSRKKKEAMPLARFLATNHELKKILADSGQLSVHATDYGVDSWLSELSEDRESDRFSELVQDAVENGKEYPPFSEWPIAIENRTVLESFQHLWRRIAEGDEDQIRAAAKENRSSPERQNSPSNANLFNIYEHVAFC